MISINTEEQGTTSIRVVGDHYAVLRGRYLRGTVENLPISGWAWCPLVGPIVYASSAHDGLKKAFAALEM